MHGTINYVDVVNQASERGWKIISQSPNATQIAMQVGAPRIPALLLALIPLVGMLLAALWIYQRGTANITIERKLTTARVVSGSTSYDINGRQDLEMFFETHNYVGNIGYYPVILTGIAVTFLVTLLIQVGG